MARRNYYTGKYKLRKSEFLSAKYYALRYNEWVAEYNALKDSLASTGLDDMPHGSNVGQPTEQLALRRVELLKKMDLITQTAEEAGEELAKYILKAVTNENVTFNNLKLFMDIPCEKDMFYDRRKKFYWLLSQRI